MEVESRGTRHHEPIMLRRWSLGPPNNAGIPLVGRRPVHPRRQRRSKRRKDPGGAVPHLVKSREPGFGSRLRLGAARPSTLSAGSGFQPPFGALVIRCNSRISDQDRDMNRNRIEALARAAWPHLPDSVIQYLVDATPSPMGAPDAGARLARVDTRIDSPIPYAAPAPSANARAS